MRRISVEDARRIAVRAQLLDGAKPGSSPDAILAVAERLRCIQIDPINVIARTQLLVLQSRLAHLEEKHLDVLAWERKELFHYWAHAASFVLTEDYPLHKMRMKRFLYGDARWGERVRAWMKENDALRRGILAQLRKHGPLRSRDLEDLGTKAWRSTGWTEGQTVSRMLDFMWTKGEIMIAGRDGLQRIWDLSHRWFPDWTATRAMTVKQGYEKAAELAFASLGVATPTLLNQHFVRGENPDLKATIAKLQKIGLIEPVEIRIGAASLPGKWFIHRDAVEALDDLRAGWEPRTALLSPFDNLIADRKRTLVLFDFDYKIEIYVPKAKRRYGYYTLPILWGDRLIGRIDAAVDRKEHSFNVLSVHAEESAPKGAGDDVAAAIVDLASFTGAVRIAWPKTIPRSWARALRGASL